MTFWEKVKSWFNKNKKQILIGGTVVLTFIGTGVGYVIYQNSTTHKDNKVSFAEWLKIASTEELDEAYEKLRLIFGKTGNRTSDMQQIGQELDIRKAKEWFEKHPPNTDPNFRWTDANRWDRD